MKSLSFDQIIGLPIKAIVEGETYAAKATIEYIKEVGFKNFETNNNPDSDIGFGELRMVIFNYTTQNEEGEPVVSTVEIPLLSLIPIPLIQIEEANLDYAINITSIEENKETKEVMLMTDFSKSAGSDERSETYNIKINIKLAQSDVPAGLTNVFTLLENQISNK